MPCFNPHPPSLAGEARYESRSSSNDRVSIHTRHHWRVKHALHQRQVAVARVSIHTRHHWRVKQSFEAIDIVWVEVSIHTRHHWRVKLEEKLGKAQRASFNPHPPSLAGEAWPWRTASRALSFQSTPAITGG